MSFNMGDTAESAGFGSYEAEVINAGVAHGDYGDQMVFVCKPKNTKMNMQTIFLSMGKGRHEFGGNAGDMWIGEGEKAFKVEMSEIILSGPKIRIASKAGLFLNALKHLGVDVKGGDMRIYQGLKLELEDVPHNEAIRRFNETHPDDKDISELSKEYAEKSGNITIPVRLIGKKKSLKQEVLEFADGKSEDEIIKWAKTEGKKMSDVFSVIDTEMEKTIGEEDEVYSLKEAK